MNTNNISTNSFLGFSTQSLHDSVQHAVQQGNELENNINGVLKLQYPVFADKIDLAHSYGYSDEQIEAMLRKREQAALTFYSPDDVNRVLKRTPQTIQQAAHIENMFRVNALRQATGTSLNDDEILDRINASKFTGIPASVLISDNDIYEKFKPFDKMRRTLFDSLRIGLAKLVASAKTPQSDRKYLEHIASLNDEQFKQAFENGQVPKEYAHLAANFLNDDRQAILARDVATSQGWDNFIQNIADFISPEPSPEPDSMIHSLAEIAPSVAAGIAEVWGLGKISGLSPMTIMTSLGAWRGSQNSNEQVFANRIAMGDDVSEAHEHAHNWLSSVSGVVHAATSAAVSRLLGANVSPFGIVNPVFQKSAYITGASLVSGAGSAASSAVNDLRSGQEINTEKAMQEGKSSALWTGLFGIFSALFNGKKILNTQRDFYNLKNINSVLDDWGYSAISENFSIQDSFYQIVNDLEFGSLSAKELVDLFKNLAGASGNSGAAQIYAQYIEALFKSGFNPKDSGFDVSSTIQTPKAISDSFVPYTTTESSFAPKPEFPIESQPVTQPTTQPETLEHSAIPMPPSADFNPSPQQGWVFIPKSDWESYNQSVQDNDIIPAAEIKETGEVMLNAQDFNRIKQNAPDFIERIQDDIRFSAGNLTNREAADSASNNQTDDNSLNWNSPRIRSLRLNIFNQWREAGYSRGQAKSIADMITDFALNYSYRTGIDPEDAVRISITNRDNIYPQNPPAENSNTVQPPVPPHEQSHSGSNTARIRTIRGTEIDVRYRLVDADDLITSTNETGEPNPDFPQDLQPRQRNRESSFEQIDRIARSLDPELLGENRLASDGAPVIGADLVVESGNGRTMAIRKAYKQGTAENYRQWLKDNAVRFGLNPNDIDNFNHPVLVRERTSDVDRIQFAREANESSVVQMSLSEHAFNDARNISSRMLYDYKPDSPLEANRSFIHAFLSGLSSNEKGTFLQADGNISSSGLHRIKNALAAKAFGDTGILNRLTETYDDNIKNISNALYDSAPRIALLEDGAVPPPYSIRNDILQAVNSLLEIRNEGGTVDNFLSQVLIFNEDEISNEAKKLLQFFDKNKRSRKKIARALNRYADLAVQEAGNSVLIIPGLELQTRSKSSLLDEAIRFADDNGQMSLFESYNQTQKLSANHDLPDDNDSVHPFIDFINSDEYKQLSYQFQKLIDEGLIDTDRITNETDPDALADINTLYDPYTWPDTPARLKALVLYPPLDKWFSEHDNDDVDVDFYDDSVLPDDIVQIKHQIEALSDESDYEFNELIEYEDENKNGNPFSGLHISASNNVSDKSAQNASSNHSLDEFRKAYEACDDGIAFVKIPDMRKKLGWSREAFDDMLRDLRDKEVLQIYIADESTMTKDEMKDCFVDENGYKMGSLTWEQDMPEVNEQPNVAINESKKSRKKAEKGKSKQSLKDIFDGYDRGMAKIKIDSDSHFPKITSSSQLSMPDNQSLNYETPVDSQNSNTENPYAFAAKSFDVNSLQPIHTFPFYHYVMHSDGLMSDMKMVKDEYRIIQDDNSDDMLIINPYGRAWGKYVKKDNEILIGDSEGLFGFSFKLNDEDIKKAFPYINLDRNIAEYLKDFFMGHNVTTEDSQNDNAELDYSPALDDENYSPDYQPNLAALDDVPEQNYSDDSATPPIKGRISWQKDIPAYEQTSIMELSRTLKDPSTVLHEIGHHMVKLLFDAVQFNGVDGQIKDDVDAILEHSGISYDDYLADNNGEKEKVYENAAEEFTKFAASGRAPNERLRKAFSRIRAWLIDLFRDLQKKNYNIDENMRRVFEHLFTSQERIDYASKIGEIASEAAALRDLLSQTQNELRSQIQNNADIHKQLQQSALDNEQLQNDLNDMRSNADSQTELSFIQGKNTGENYGIQEGREYQKLKDKEILDRALAREHTKLSELRDKKDSQIQRTREQKNNALSRLEQKKNEQIQRIKERYSDRLDALADSYDERIAKLKKRLEEIGKIKPAIQRNIKQIARMAKSKSISYNVQQEINDLLSGFDLKKRSRATLSHRQDINELLKNDPNAVAQLTPDEIRFAGTTNIADMTLDDLRYLKWQVKILYDKGRREFEQWQADNRQRRTDIRNKLFERISRFNPPDERIVTSREDIGKQYKGIKGKAQKIKDWSSAVLRTPDRVFDILDGGGAKYNGAWVENFIDIPREKINEAQGFINSRRNNMIQKLAALGFKISDFAKIAAVIDNQKFSYDVVMEIYLGMRNPKKARAIIFGNFVNPKGYSPEQAKDVINQLISKLSPEHMKAAELVIKDHNDNFPRLNGSLINAFNKGMKQETDYTSMHRLNSQSGAFSFIDPDDDSAVRSGLSDAQVLQKVETGFMLSRQNISDENQQPLDLGLFSNWLRDVSRHEFAAALGQTASDLMSVLMSKNDNGQTLMRMISDRFGNSMRKSVTSFFNDTFTDNTRTADEFLRSVAGALSRNMSAAYIAYNMGVYVMQAMSYPLFLMSARPDYMLSSVAKFFRNPRAFLDNVYELSPTIKNMGRDPVENNDKLMRDLNSSFWQKFINAGLEPTSIIDRITKAIGWQAVYDTNIKRGLSHEKAVREADRAVRLTQPPSYTRDTMRITRNGSLAALKMKFTSALAAAWNMTTYDFIQKLFSNDWNNIKSAFFTFAGLALSSMLVKFMHDGGPDHDNDEDISQWVAGAFSEQFINSIPLIGKDAMQSYNKYFRGKYGQSQFDAFNAPVDKVFNVAGIVSKEDKSDEDYARLGSLVLEAIALTSGGVPYSGLKQTIRSLMMFADGDPLKGIANFLGFRQK